MGLVTPVIVTHVTGMVTHVTGMVTHMTGMVTHMTGHTSYGGPMCLVWCLT